MLHVKNRRCRIGKIGGGAGDTLTLSVVREYDQLVEKAFELPFAYRVVDAAAADHLQVHLSAPSGPLGISNHRVEREAVALDERRTFLHFGDSYDHHMLARMVTRAYRVTFGNDKLGFTAVGAGAGGEPEYIRSTRGLVERNARRHFLTLDAYLSDVRPRSSAQFETPLHHWSRSAGRYARHLLELDVATYLLLRGEDRQRNGPPP